MAIPRNLATFAASLDSSGQSPKIQVSDSSVVITDSGSNGTIVFNTDNVERARITNGGALLINTATNDNAANRLYTIGYQGYASSATDLASSATKASARICGSTDSSMSSFMGALANGNGQYIQVANTSGTASYALSLNPYGGNVGIGTASPTGDYFGDRILQITGSTSAAIKFERTSATARKWEIGCTTSGNFDFADTVASTTTPRMSISNAGNVGIGSTSPGSTLTVVGSTTGGAVNITNSRSTTDGDTRATSMSLSAIASTNTTEYFAVFYPNGGMIGSIKMNNNAVAFNTTSDVRKKENIVDSESCVDKLKQVKVRNFNWINDENKSNIHGFIAQELHEVYPYAVSVGGKDPEENPWSVDYGRLTPLLTKVLQEAMTRIETLEAQNAAFEARLAALEAK